MKSVRLIVAIGTILSLGVAAYAQGNIVVPNANTNTMGANGLNSPLRQLARTMLQQLPASELGTVPVGAQITGISFRLWSGATAAWPPSDATWTNYDMYLGQSAVAEGAVSSTLMNNYVAGTRTAVRSGPLTIPAGAFQLGTPTTPFSYTFNFATPYTYTGGSLIVELTHTGNNINSAEFVDHPTPWKPGQTYLAYATSYNATSLPTLADAPLTTKVIWVPEPASLALMALALVFRRR